MKLKDGKKIVRVRPGYGRITQVLVDGHEYYTDVREGDVVFESAKDHEAWEACQPEPTPEYIDV